MPEAIRLPSYEISLLSASISILGIPGRVPPEDRDRPAVLGRDVHEPAVGADADPGGPVLAGVGAVGQGLEVAEPARGRVAEERGHGPGAGGDRVDIPPVGADRDLVAPLEVAEE